MKKSTAAAIATSLGLAAPGVGQQVNSGNAISYSGPVDILNFEPSGNTAGGLEFKAASLKLAQFRDISGKESLMSCFEVEANKQMPDNDGNVTLSKDDLARAGRDIGCAAEPSTETETAAKESSNKDKELDALLNDLVAIKFIGSIPDFSVTATVRQKLDSNSGALVSGVESVERSVHLVSVFSNSVTKEPMVLDCRQIDFMKEKTVGIIAKSDNDVTKRLFSKQYDQFDAGAKALNCKVNLTYN